MRRFFKKYQCLNPSTPTDWLNHHFQQQQSPQMFTECLESTLERKLTYGIHSCWGHRTCVQMMVSSHTRYQISLAPSVLYEAVVLALLPIWTTWGWGGAFKKSWCPDLHPRPITLKLRRQKGSRASVMFLKPGGQCTGTLQSKTRETGQCFSNWKVNVIT